MAKVEKKKVKTPTPLKRDAWNEKMRVINKSFKSSVRSTIRSFEDSMKTQDKERIQSALDQVYSVVDKGVKRGIYKINKASRIKSRLTHRFAASST